MIVEIFETGDERRMLIRAAFSQAKDDGISGKMYYNHLRKTQEVNSWSKMSVADVNAVG